MLFGTEEHEETERTYMEEWYKLDHAGSSFPAVAGGRIHPLTGCR